MSNKITKEDIRDFLRGAVAVIATTYFVNVDLPLITLNLTNNIITLLLFAAVIMVIEYFLDRVIKAVASGNEMNWQIIVYFAIILIIAMNFTATVKS